jgi:hypothetical protein
MRLVRKNLQALKQLLGLQTATGVCILVVALLTWTTMLVLVFSRIYSASLTSLLFFTIKMLAMYIFISITSNCVKHGGCHKYNKLLALSSITLSVIFVVSV